MSEIIAQYDLEGFSPGDPVEHLITPGGVPCGELRHHPDGTCHAALSLTFEDREAAAWFVNKSRTYLDAIWLDTYTEAFKETWGDRLVGETQVGDLEGFSSGSSVETLTTPEGAQVAEIRRENGHYRATVSLLFVDRNAGMAFVRRTWGGISWWDGEYDPLIERLTSDMLEGIGDQFPSEYPGRQWGERVATP